MNPKRLTMTPKEIVKRLESEGWFIARRGPGDHGQLKHPARSVRVNISLDETLLDQIDRVARARGETRSGFLSSAARSRLAG